MSDVGSVCAMIPKETSLPFEVEIELLDTLHGSLKSLGAGNFGVAAVTLICAFASENPLLRILSVLLFVSAVGRFITAFVYRRAAPHFGPAELRVWKRRTILSSSTYSLLLGLSGATGVSLIADPLINMPLVACVIGYAASSASRNAGVPACVISQLVLSVAPLGAAYIFTGGVANVAIAALLFVATFAMIEISRSVYATLVRALTFGHDKHALAEALAEQAANFNAALTNMSHGLAMFDANDGLVICNRRFAEFFRLDEESMSKGASPARIVCCAARYGLIQREDVKAITEQFADRTRCHAPEELALSLSDRRTLELSFQSMAHGGAVVIAHDVTERKAQQEKIAQMARFDKLTGLPNRTQFEEKFAEILTRNSRADLPFAVVCIDLDHFKEVNDTLTHMVGDQLLVAVAARMSAAIRFGDHLARFGGDEFVLILPSLNRDNAVADVSAVLQRLIDVVGEPYEIDSQKIVIGMSAGVAISPNDGRARDEILRAADLALYKAKQLGRGAFHFFEPALDVAAQERRQIILDMRAALAEGQFRLEYQPIVDVTTGRIACCEALMRWSHPTLTIEPDKFIAIAEETGMIGELGRWAIRQACHDAVAWPFPAAVAVNLSPIQFKRDNLPAAISQALAESGLDPARLELEITESLLISCDESTKKAVNEIIGLGCSLTLDDFGRGYSTFSYLINFPFRKVKLDKAFIDHIETRADHRAILAAVRQLASGLSMSIVAEGVETQSQLNILVAENIRYAQGWLFSKSVAPELIPWTQFEKAEAAIFRAA